MGAAMSELGIYLSHAETAVTLFVNKILEFIVIILVEPRNARETCSAVSEIS